MTKRSIKGGFEDLNNSNIVDSVSSTANSWGEYISQGASDLWNKAKNATSNNYNSSSYTGGKRTRRKKMRGGFVDNTITTGLAARAANISGINSAKPHNLVGGKSKKHRYYTQKQKHSRFRKNIRKPRRKY